MSSDRPWFASYGNDIPFSINADAWPSVVAMAESAMKRFADKPAFRSFGQTITYADVDRQSRAFAAWLQNKLGIRKGDRIAVMTPNLLAFPIAMLGIARAGAVQVNVNPLYTARELEHQLDDSGARAILVFSGVSATVAAVLEHADQLTLDAVLVTGVSDGSSTALPGPSTDARLHQAFSFADVLAEGASLPYTPVILGGEDLLFLQYTGGTTGISKAAELSHRNMVANVEQFKAIVSSAVRPGEEVVVTAIPLYHIFALMANFITYFSIGAENWLVANPRDMDSFINVLVAARPTVLTGVNTIFASIAAHPRATEVDFSRLRLAGGGGTAVLESTATKWQALTGTFIREGYGLSETSPIVSFNTEHVRAFNGTTGVPLPSTDVRLITDDGTEPVQGAPGEVCVKGPQVMRGYWNQPEANAQAFTIDGYFRTGDIGIFTPDGLLKIVDRKKDMIIVSGFNVFPNEVEAIVSACAGVAECACIGVPDEHSGEAARLFIVRAHGSNLTADQVIAHCRNQLTAYKVPKQVQFVEELPKSTVGKVLRRELRIA